MNFVIQQTEDFAGWRKALKDLRAATAYVDGWSGLRQGIWVE